MRMRSARPAKMDGSRHANSQDRITAKSPAENQPTRGGLVAIVQLPRKIRNGEQDDCYRDNKPEDALALQKSSSRQRLHRAAQRISPAKEWRARARHRPRQSSRAEPR